MSGNSTHAHGATTKLVLWVWGWLLALTLVEVWLGYKNFSAALMLTLLIGLSVIKAAMIIAYFMHLRYERFSLFLTLWPITVLCMLLIMLFFFPDSFRLGDPGMRPPM